MASFNNEAKGGRMVKEWDFEAVNFSKYRTRAIIGGSWFEVALVYKPRILHLKNEEFPFFST